MKLGFLLCTWLVYVQHLTFLWAFEVEDPDAESVFDTIAEDMLSSLKRSLEIPIARQKRELKKHSLVDDSGVYRLLSVKPVASLCQPAVRTLFIDVSSETYAVCVTTLTTNSPAEVVVGYYKEHTWYPFDRWFVNNAVDAAAFYFKDYLYILVADSEKKLGTDLVQINLKTKERIVDHTVTGSYVTSISVWYMKIKGLYNLAVANSGAYGDSADMTTEVSVYEWKGTYFDKYSSFSGYNVRDIEPFHIHGAAFIAIANFKRGRNNYDVDSEILRYDQDGNKWISHQKIRTYGAMDWEFFSLGTSLGQEFFLAVANKGKGETSVKSMIYKFVEDKFVPFQCLPTTRAVSFASYSVDGAFLLAVANENDAVNLYQYDGWRFVKSGVQYTRGAMSDGASHLTFHKVMSNNENVLILSVSNPRHYLYPSVFEIGFVHENPLDDWHSSSSDWCLSMLQKLEKIDLDKTFDFKDVIFTDQSSVSINGDVVFEKGFVGGTLRTPRLKEVSTQAVFDDKILQDLTNLHGRLEVIKQKLEGFSNILENSLKIDGDQTIKNHLQFQDAVFNCGSQACHFKNINTEILNGEEIGDWSNQLVFMDREQFINGTIMVKEIKTSSMHVSGFIDGIKSDDLVTKSGNHLITGHKSFDNLVTAQDLQVSGKLDGVTISPDAVLLSTGHQPITGDITFDGLNTTWLRATYVNDKNLVEFLHDLVLTDKPRDISGKKTFNDVAIGELLMTPGSTINGVDFADLWKNTLWTDGDQEINAEMTLSDVMFNKDLYVSGSVSGIQIPGPRIVDITESAVLTAPKEFKNSIIFGSLEVLESLNGIPLVQAPDGSKQLDILLKTGNQIITGTKTFHTIHLDADSDVKGLVDGVDLSEFEASVLRKNVSVVTNGTWEFNSMYIKGPLIVQGKISNVNLKDVYDRALKLSDPIIPEIIFKEYVYVEDLQSNNINDVDVRNDLVLRNDEHQVITGKKTFEDVVLVDGYVRGLVNNMNFSFLNDVLLVIGTQKINSKIFKKNVKINKLTVRGTINGISMEDIVTLGSGKIYGSRVLNNVSFSTIEAKNVEVTGKVNDINLKEMIDDTMTYDEYQEVTGEKDIQGTIFLTKDSNLQTKDLNGIDFQALWTDATFIDSPEEIAGVVEFADNVVFNGLSFNGTIDGVSDWDMRYNWMQRNKPQTVEGNVNFKNGFSAKDLDVQTVNGLDLGSLQSEIVKINEESEIRGPIIFEKSIISQGKVGLTGTVQGIDLSEEAVTKNSVVVTGEKRFAQDIVVEGDLTVDGLINNINLEDLCNKTFLKSEVNISRLVIKGDVVLTEGTVAGTLAGVDLSILKDVAVRNDGSEIKLEGVKTFTNITFDGPVILKGKFGDVNLSELAANYMSLTKDQDIPAEMEFDELDFKGLLSVRNFDTADNVINNINLQELNDRLLKASGNQNVTATYFIDEVHFTDVSVNGKVNGLELPGGVMRHNRANYIQSPKVFEQAVIVNGNLDVDKGKTIQGVDVSDWFQKAVLKEGKFQIRGQKTFNELQLNDVRVEGLFDTLKISEEHLLMAYGNQIITGRKVINGSVAVEGSLTVNGLINAINITELAMTTLQRDRNNTVTGSKYFQKPLTTVSLQAPSVAGVDILALKEKLDTTVDLSQLENRLEEIEGLVSHMQTAFDNQAVLFQYYELFEEFAISSAYGWLYVSGPDCGELLLLLDNSTSNIPCTSTRMLSFDSETNSFLPDRQELITSNAVSIKSLTLNSTCLFVANGNQNLPCSGNLDHLEMTTLDIYTWDVDSFKKLSSMQTHQPVDMAAFKVGVKACLVLLEIDGTRVYCGSTDNLNFVVHEVLFTRGGQKVSVVQSKGKTILAIAAEDTLNARQNYMEGQRYVDIYVWNSEKMQFLAPKQFISSTFTQSLSLMKHADKNSEVVFLALAEGSIPRIHNKPRIVIFRYDEAEDDFKRYQEIDDYGTLEWLSLKTGELLLFAVDSQKGQIKVYQYKGASGFVKRDVIKALGTTSIHAFIRPDPEDWMNHYLALVGPHAVMAQPTQGGYNAKILKSKVKGKHRL